MSTTPDPSMPVVSSHSDSQATPQPAEPAAAPQSGAWISVNDHLPQHGQRIEGGSFREHPGVSGSWVEIWNTSEPLGRMTHWRLAASQATEQPADRAQRDELQALSDSFPEINPSNYNCDDVDRLNAWGIEVVAALQRKGD